LSPGTGTDHGVDAQDIAAVQFFLPARDRGLQRPRYGALIAAEADLARDCPRTCEGMRGATALPDASQLPAPAPPIG